jgi:hypothetical protein
VRRIDHWDSRSFGAETAAKMQTPANKFPTNFDYDVASESTSAKITGVAQKLAAAFTAGDAKADDELFSNDAVYLDRVASAHPRQARQIPVPRARDHAVRQRREA